LHCIAIQEESENSHYKAMQVQQPTRQEHHCTNNLGPPRWPDNAVVAPQRALAKVQRRVGSISIDGGVSSIVH